MMRGGLIALVLLSSPAVAQDTPQADVDAMTVAIEEAGCVVTVENGDAVLAASGLDADQTMAVIATLYEQGLVALLDDGTMKLTNEVCP